MPGVAFLPVVKDLRLSEPREHDEADDRTVALVVAIQGVDDQTVEQAKTPGPRGRVVRQRDAPDYSGEHQREQPVERRIITRCATPPDRVIALPPLRDEARNLARMILQIARNDPRAIAGRET